MANFHKEFLMDLNLIALGYFGTKHQGLLFSVIKLKYKLYNLSLQAQRMVLLEIIFSVLCCGY